MHVEFINPFILNFLGKSANAITFKNKMYSKINNWHILKQMSQEPKIELIFIAKIIMSWNWWFGNLLLLFWNDNNGIHYTYSNSLLQQKVEDKAVMFKMSSWV